MTIIPTPSQKKWVPKVVEKLEYVVPPTRRVRELGERITYSAMHKSRITSRLCRGDDRSNKSIVMPDTGEDRGLVARRSMNDKRMR